LSQKFKNSTESLKQFFDKLEGFPLIQTFEFSNLFDAKALAEDEVYKAQEKAKRINQQIE
jgi:hypothetical protein